MFRILQKWQERYLGDEQAVVLLLLLLSAVLLVLWIGGILAPFFASVVLAYLLQGLVTALQQRRVPRLAAVIAASLLFVFLLFGTLLWLVPLLWQQLRVLSQDLPDMATRLQVTVLGLSQQFSGIFGEQQVQVWIETINNQITELSRSVLSQSLATLLNLVQLGVYLFLVPLLVFFMLKDSASLLRWCTNFLPERRGLLQEVWAEMDCQLANYVRGKVVEILIIGVAAYMIFAVLGLNYAALLGLLVGLSVLVPYVGAVVVTVPVLAIGYFQWGTDSTFLYLAVSYAVLQILDANVLVPLLFSEAVSLHPVAIILAVLVFGGLWGFWGIFFAIPLATLIKAVLGAWPRHD